MQLPKSGKLPSGWRVLDPLGCFKKHLFLRFQLAFFILCTNVLKSYQKKFGVIWRSFDPPTRGSYFVWELPLKYKGNLKKIENVLYFLSFLSNSFLFSCFVMATMIDNHISKHFALIFHFPIFQGVKIGSFWPKSPILHHFDPLLK